MDSSYTEPLGHRHLHGRRVQTHVPAEDYAAVAEHLSPDEIAALLALIVTINWMHIVDGRIARIRVTFDPRAILDGG